MEIVDFGRSPGRTVEAYGSVGVTARALVRGDLAAVTVLQVAAGGEVGRHRAPVDQLMVVASGHGAAQAADGAWQPIGAGQAVVWRAGEEHATRAVEEMIALVVEMPELPLVSR